ncbi:MAG: DNA-3-methyladenine glycosylase 2 family protein, partial [Actinobacteria bacterium]|nr:DNA-3-methyladenine glycosylase 2 family protein [Actinomycetota bacterium]
HGAGLVALTPAAGYVAARLRLHDHRDLAAAVARVRRLLDLDADPVAVDEVLAGRPALAGLVARRPGLRSPGAVDGFEMAARAIVGQQVSVAGARTVLGRLVAEYGTPAFAAAPGDCAVPAEATGPGDLPAAAEWRLFPEPATLAAVDPVTLPMPRARGRSLVALAAAMADGSLVLGAGSDRASTRAALLALPGIGPWTADYLLMRAVGDPDVYLDTDLGVRHALDRLAFGRTAGALDPPATAPWRSYLTHHLWASLADPMPTETGTPLPDKDIR